MKNNFIDDNDKMQDFLTITKEEFLNSYSYLSEEEYDNTMDLLNKVELDEKFYKKVALNYIDTFSQEYLKEDNGKVIHGFYEDPGAEDEYDNYEDYVKNSYLLMNVEEDIEDIGVDSSGTWDFYLTPLELNKLGIEVPKQEEQKEHVEEYDLERNFLLNNVPQKIFIIADMNNEFVANPLNKVESIPLLYADKYNSYYYDYKCNEMWHINTDYISNLYNSPAKTFERSETSEYFKCNDGSIYNEEGIYDDELEAGIFPLKDTQELRFNNIDVPEYSNCEIDLITESSDIKEIMDYIQEYSKKIPYISSDSPSEIVCVCNKLKDELAKEDYDMEM